MAIFTAGLALLAAGFPSTAVAAGTLTFGATADAYTVSTGSTTNYGSATSLRARSASASYTSYRSYLRFDLSGTGGS